ncbi:PLP-dependent cysteine synthase family protein [Mycobacterium sp. SMC-4]|uniref:PLP-dependent cysteine synthase family protein n=1 Tax=Mycobacterium sp. SMC-4 TaxID=2857059 RepID=UPI003D01281B
MSRAGCRPSRDWVDNAVRLIEADARRSADTHLLRYPLPSWAADCDLALYLKDETTHITGSLKHRLARSLFLYGLCNGWIGEDTTVIEASSGSTAVSEAYFAAMLGLRFIAVMPESTSAAKVALIQSQGGRCHFVRESAQVYDEAQRLADETGGHYLDQFTHAERATDWRGNNNIAESIFEQMTQETHPIPEWIVVGAGTGGTSATIGRYIRYRRHPTKLCVVDPENSAFFPSYATGDPDVVTGASSRIEGIGRPRVEPSFLPGVVDVMVAVPDAASVAAAHHVSRVLGRRVGPSTGTNIWGAFGLLAQMAEQGCRGSVVTLLADGGDRYAETYFCDEWLASHGMALSEPAEVLAEFERSGCWPLSELRISGPSEVRNSHSAASTKNPT